MADTGTSQMAAFDAAAETPQFTPLSESSLKVHKMFYLDQPKKDILLTLVAVIIILICLIYIPYKVTDNFRFFIYAVTLVPAAMGLGYTIATYRATKKTPAST